MNVFREVSSKIDHQLLTSRITFSPKKSETNTNEENLDDLGTMESFQYNFGSFQNESQDTHAQKGKQNR